ncbi:hypothetical protein V492_03803, partial [Pseudogymnoascus sp. VKM F-4246]
KHIPRPPPEPKPPVIPPGDEHQALEQQDQQLLLDVVRKAFPQCEKYEELKPVLEGVKEAVFRADWQAAFGSAEGREAWVIKWGAERAVWFANLLVRVVETLGDDALFKPLWSKERDEEEEEEGGKDDEDEDDVEPLRVVSFGGGPAEVLALAGIIRHFRSDAHGKSKAELEEEDEDEDASEIIDLHLANNINWSREISTTHAALLSPPTLSKYASASAIANSTPFLSKSALDLELHRFSALEASQEEVAEMVGDEPALITLFYTVAGLAATSVAKTVALLLKLTIAAPKGSVVVIFDRADDERNAEGKKGYPLRYLLDMAFLGKKPPGEEEEESAKPAWKMLLEDGERVVKASDGLRHAVLLETGKAQVYVFRRL